MNWDTINPQYAHIGINHDDLVENYKSIEINYDGKSILDYGCGGGHFAKWVTENFDCMYTGYDISKRSIKAARELNPKLEFLNRIRDFDQYDIIVCLAVIQHMTDDMYHQFKITCELLQPKEIYLQYRYGNSYNPDDIIYRLRLESVDIHGYKVVERKPTNQANDYVYELLRNHTS